MEFFQNSSSIPMDYFGCYSSSLRVTLIYIIPTVNNFFKKSANRKFQVLKVMEICTPTNALMNDGILK